MMQIKNKKDTSKEPLRMHEDNSRTTSEARRLMRSLQDGGAVDKLMEEVWGEALQQDSYTALDREKSKREAHMLLKHIEHKKRTWVKRVTMTVSGIAACVALIIGSIGYANLMEEQNVTYLVASTTFGERKTVTLPDGTVLTLNSCSQVRYPDKFIGKERLVQLEGEGYFDVARNESQPFVVDAHCFDVKVLGTQFNVKAYTADELASVEVESGKVQVDMPEAMMRLAANEQVWVNNRSGEYNKLRETHPIAVWKEGGLRFEHTPIRDVVKALERMYDCRIVFDEGCDFDNLISGEHDNNSLESVLQSIEYTSGIHYRINGKQVSLFK